MFFTNFKDHRTDVLSGLRVIFLNFEREKRHAKFIGMEVCNADGTSYVCEQWMVLLTYVCSGMVLLTYVCSGMVLLAT